MRVLLAIVMLALAPCAEAPPPAPVTPGPAPLPAPIEPERTCREACANMARLGCEGWKGSPGEDERWMTADDVPCWRVCETVEIEAIDARGLSLRPECVSAAATCRTADECFR
jgi:hypothetical protein